MLDHEELFVGLFSWYQAAANVPLSAIPPGCEGVLVFRAHRPRRQEISAFNTLLMRRSDGVLCCPVLRRKEGENDDRMLWLAADLLDVSKTEFRRKPRLAVSGEQPQPQFPCRFTSEVPYSGEGEWHWLSTPPADIEPSHHRIIDWVHRERLRHLMHLTF